MMLYRFSIFCFFGLAVHFACNADDSGSDGAEFFERRIRPILVQHCYECHSEAAGEQQGGLLLDRESGWLSGGDTNKAILPGNPDASLLIDAVSYQRDDLQMPPEGPLEAETIELLRRWIERGAPGPVEDLGATEFSRLGDQTYLFDKAKDHWSFRSVQAAPPPMVDHRVWDRTPIDRFVFDAMAKVNLSPSRRANPRDFFRRLNFALVGLPPSQDQLRDFLQRVGSDRAVAIEQAVNRLIDSPEFGQHIARMWLDVARYADTDSAYRPDTKTPHYFPFAFTYRDYVVDAFNADKPYDQFLKEQFAADLIGFDGEDPEIAALGFLGVAPHATRAQQETLDDWIDVTTRGLMGLTVACARCHDHKYEPVPTVDYYSLRGVFNALSRPNPLDEQKQPILTSYVASDADQADYRRKRAAVEKKIADNAGKKAKNNNRSIATKIRETELAELLLFHPGAPGRAMVVLEKRQIPASFVHVRGDAAARGADAPPRFLKIIDRQQPAFDDGTSGRLSLIQKIASADNPLTARVYVNRVWGHLIGSHLVATPSDFGLQGDRPSHPELLDWLADDFIHHGWSTKRLVRQIVLTETFAQSSQHDDAKAEIDQNNRLLWRANRRHLSIEALRDSVLAVSGQLDRRPGGHPAPLWGTNATPRRTLYGYINRFNLDPTLRAFDFPTPMQSQGFRGESIVAPQGLFLMNSPFVIEQTRAMTQADAFANLATDEDRISYLFARILQRQPAAPEIERINKYLQLQQRIQEVSKSKKYQLDGWPMIAQSLMMSNEFQYVD